jgi:hypothetical protein
MAAAGTRAFQAEAVHGVSPHNSKEKTMDQSNTKPYSSLISYDVQKTKGIKIWTRVGIAWPLKDKEGFTVQLNAVPLSGKIVFLPPEPKTEDKAEQKE